MIFTYYWKSSDGNRHTDDIEAENRDAAFAQLRTRGIRAIKVEPKGWETGKGYRGVRKRIVVALVFVVALVASIVAYLGGRHSQPLRNSPGLEGEILEARTGRRIAQPRPRKQIPGLKECGHAIDKIFPNSSERILSLFAQPGQDAGCEEIVLSSEVEENFYDVEGDAVWIEPDDPKPVADLKRIVAGIKEETSIYLASGKTVRELVDHYVQRQRMEADYRKAAIASFDLTQPDAEAHREALNRRLDALNLEHIPPVDDIKDVKSTSK